MNVANIANQSTERLRALGIDIVYEAHNGVRVLKIKAEGIVNKEKDWDYSKTYFHNQEEVCFRIVGIADGKFKDLLENTNFMHCAFKPYGIVELYRTFPVQDMRQDILDEDGNVSDKETGNIWFQVAILDANGKILFNSVQDTKYSRQMQYDCRETHKEFIKDVMDATEIITDYILKCGINREMQGIKDKIVCGNSFISMQMQNISNKQIITVGNALDKSRSNVILFDRVTGKIIDKRISAYELRGLIKKLEV